MTDDETMSTLDHLECSQCGREFDADKLQTVCPDCKRPLMARYDLAEAAGRISLEKAASRPPDLWRWLEVLPVRHTRHIVTLGEGGTPLLRAHRLEELLGLRELYIKDEGLNPTGTFKARGMSVAISRAVELGVREIMVPTAGNAGGAMAAYAAHAGLKAYVYMPVDAPAINQAEVRMAGAELVLVDGLIGDARRVACEDAAKAVNSRFELSTLMEPYRLEGKKTMGYELALDMAIDGKARLPDAIVYPTGGGTGLIGMWKAFDEMVEMGWIGPEDKPKMVSVQSEGCAPIVRAFEAGAEQAEYWENAHTIAAGLRVPSAIGDRLILRALYESGGMAVSVADEEILAAQRRMAEYEGVLAAPEGAATLAAVEKLLESGWLSDDETVVIFNTGTGLKYTELLIGD